MQEEKPKYLRGTIFLGAPGTGKSFLMQHRALDELRRQEEARLVFVGFPVSQLPVLALAQGAHVAGEDVGKAVIEGDRMTAFFANAGGENEEVAAEGRRLVIETLRAALVAENRNKLILALDEPFAFFRTEAERDELFILLSTLLDAPVPSLTFFISFQTIAAIRNHSGFGSTAVALFRRLHEKFIFTSGEPGGGAGDHELAAFAGCPIVNPTALRRGEAVHVYHHLSELVDIGLEGNGVVYSRPHELKSVGFLRAREIRGESMAEPIASALSAGLLLAALLAAVARFVIHLDVWAAFPIVGVIYYVLSVVAAFFSPTAYRHMRSMLIAAIIAASVSRSGGEHLSEDLG
jgi:KaiC/GvpD/RAD55 family RecA-like ATPase